MGDDYNLPDHAWRIHAPDNFRLTQIAPAFLTHGLVTPVTAFPPARCFNQIGDVRYPIRTTADSLLAPRRPHS